MDRVLGFIGYRRSWDVLVVPDIAKATIGILCRVLVTLLKKEGGAQISKIVNIFSQR